MENKARYTIVGLFVIIFSICLIIFVLWQARYNFKNAQAYEYRIYTKNSIAGLNENSFVEYKGLNIGSVKRIGINPKNLEEIEIILEITNNEVIKTNSYAIIESQGITGNKNIEISGGTVKFETLVPTEDSYAVIPLRQSFFDNLTSDAQNITRNVDTLVNNMNKLLNNNNINHISTSLANIENISKNFNKTVDKINVLLEKDVQNSFKNINTLTKEWTNVSLEVKKILENDVKGILSKIDSTLDESANIGKVMTNLENTLEKVDNTLDTLNENGGDILFKTRDVKYGPQETINDN